MNKGKANKTVSSIDIGRIQSNQMTTLIFYSRRSYPAEIRFFNREFTILMNSHDLFVQFPVNSRVHVHLCNEDGEIALLDARDWQTVT
jgi:hypothetical protein